MTVRFGHLIRPFLGRKPENKMTRHWSEDFALTFLQRRGLKLICRNYQIRQGEIDLILRDNEQIIFLEVRYRASDRFGRPEETINVAKRNRLKRTAEHFLACHQDLGAQPCRFDVLAILGPRENPVSNWIRDVL
jgi:putative endonuclease